MPCGEGDREETKREGKFLGSDRDGGKIAQESVFAVGHEASQDVLLQYYYVTFSWKKTMHCFP